MTTSAKLTVLGARGSIAVSGREYVRYGGATTCFRLQAEDCTVFLDAGTGMLHHCVAANDERRCHILLTHPHADHIYGLPLFRPLYSPDFQVSIWGAERMEKSVRQQVDCLMQPPLWPISSEGFRAAAEFITFRPGQRLELSPSAYADTLEVSHPGGCVAYKLTVGDKTLVFATDVELFEQTAQKLAFFAYGCDLLVLDAQYTDDELGTHVGFGHSSVGKSLDLIKKCAPHAALLTHHDPYRTDDELDEIARALPYNTRLAREGMEVTL